MWVIEARQSLRRLFARANRRAAAAEVVVLALGLSFMGTVFALVEPFTIASLPYPDPGRLAFVQVSSNGLPAGGRLPTLDDWISDPLVESIAPIGRRISTRTQSPNGAVILVLHEVSREFLMVLGLPIPTEEWEPGAELGATPMLLTDMGRQTLGTSRRGREPCSRTKAERSESRAACRPPLCSRIPELLTTSTGWCRIGRPARSFLPMPSMVKERPLAASRLRTSRELRKGRQ